MTDWLTIVLVGGDEGSAASASCQRVEGVELLPTEEDTAEARNHALAAARGTYVWFVERGDLLLPGTLAHVADKLAATEPDVLLVHHSTIDNRGHTHEGEHGRRFRWLSKATHRMSERPGIGDAAPRAWNKLLRRAHLEACGARFSPGGHGELTLTWPALLTAERIAATPRNCYTRMRPPDDDASDVFEKYEAVLAGPGDPALVLPAMIRHELKLLRSLPESDQREFFHRISQAVRRHRDDLEWPEERAARLRWRAVERDQFAAFRMLDSSREPRRSIGLMRRQARNERRIRRLHRYYEERLSEPIDPDLAAFAAYWSRGYSCNPRAIYEAARELVPRVRGVWVVREELVKHMPADVEHVVTGTREYFDLIARAAVLVNNVNFPLHLVKRDGATYVQTHHGTPLKHMGLDLRDTAVSGRQMDFEDMLERVGRWDLSISQNPHSTRIWERVYPGSYESLEVGYPRNDRLVRTGKDEVSRVRRELGIEPGQTAILYAPTHREYQPGYLPVLDLGRVADGLGPDHVILARPHYFYDADASLRDLHGAGLIRNVATHPSIEDLCLAADVLVTDYSSIMFDYAVLDRPIVIHSPDWEVYRAVRGAYFDIVAEGPGVVTRSEEELIGAFRSRAVWAQEAQRARAEFRRRFCALDDGRAAERVVRRVWLSDREGTASAVASGAR